MCGICNQLRSCAVQALASGVARRGGGGAGAGIGALRRISRRAFGAISGAHFNPAVTLASGVSNAFAGIRPTDVDWFIAAQWAGAFAATVLFKWMMPTRNEEQAVVL
jgi:glycerol uptake facilitator-like aquaporin